MVTGRLVRSRSDWRVRGATVISPGVVLVKLNFLYDAISKSLLKNCAEDS